MIVVSAKSARTLREMLERLCDRSKAEESALAELQRALGGGRKRQKKPEQLEREAEEKTAKQLHRDETSAIYAAVEKRCAGRCENPECGQAFSASNPPEMDHVFGRGKVPQTERNCWMLCRICHREKTNPKNGVIWLHRFADHAAQFCFSEERRKALAEADWRMAKAANNLKH